jgi:hypothetical protein
MSTSLERDRPSAVDPDEQQLTPSNPGHRRVAGVAMSVPLSSPPPVEASSAAPGLISVLDHLGHACPGGCRSAAEELGARVWFTGRGASSLGSGHTAVVVIDTSGHGASIARSIELVRQVNACTHAHGIHVTRGRDGDEGHALATLNPANLELTR